MKGIDTTIAQIRLGEDLSHRNIITADGYLARFHDMSLMMGKVVSNQFLLGIPSNEYFLHK